jgi:hypothetical protein
MRTVYHAETLVDAHLVKDVLEQAGLPAFIAGEYLIGGMGQLPARDFLAVNVPDSCVAAAEPLVRDIAAQLMHARTAIDTDDGLDTAGMHPASPL